MIMNRFALVAAIFVASMGTIAGACKHPRAKETSATPNNNSAPDNTVGVISSKSKAEVSRNLGTALCAA
jgi:hypothetical protein